MNNIQYFEKQAKYWAKRFRIGDITLKPKRMWAFAQVHYQEKLFFYNPKHVKNYDRSTLMEVIFHELGHLYRNNSYTVYPYDHTTNRRISEYIAQKRSFYWLKKHYPKYYKKEVKNAKKVIEHCLTYPKHYHIYFESWSQLPEYAKYL